MSRTGNPGMRKDYTGRRFGMVSVISWASAGTWLCRCDCGKERTFVVCRLISGEQTSCGCLYRHGYTANRKKHPAYSSWKEMRSRCLGNNPKYAANYKARGIVICERWNNFANFYADMGDRPPGTSLDRIDNNGNYEPSNCRWATKAQQTRNTRVVKLNEEIVSAMRRGDISPWKAAKQVGCSHQTAWLAKIGRTWK